MKLKHQMIHKTTLSKEEDSMRRDCSDSSKKKMKKVGKMTNMKKVGKMMIPLALKMTTLTVIHSIQKTSRRASAWEATGNQEMPLVMEIMPMEMKILVILKTMKKDPMKKKTAMKKATMKKKVPMKKVPIKKKVPMKKAPMKKKMAMEKATMTKKAPMKKAPMKKASTKKVPMMIMETTINLAIISKYKI